MNSFILHEIIIEQLNPITVHVFEESGFRNVCYWFDWHNGLCHFLALVVFAIFLAVVVFAANGRRHIASVPVRYAELGARSVEAAVCAAGRAGQGSVRLFQAGIGFILCGRSWPTSRCERPKF